jgi:hypothetical protein
LARAVLYKFDNTNWAPSILGNSDFIIQPQEVMACTLLSGWSGVPTEFDVTCCQSTRQLPM